MAQYGVGTMVLYHNGSYDIPSVVFMNHDHWYSYGGAGQPAVDEYHLMCLELGGQGFTPDISEGTSPGEFSLISYTQVAE